MAFFDNFNNPLYAPVQNGMNGLGNLLEGMNIWGTKLPPYLSGTPASGTTEAIPGLLTDTEQEKLKNQALLSGGIGALATYLAQPKNQGYGSALPYIGKAYLGGMQASQGAYDQATQNLLTQGKLAELKREADNAKLLKQYQSEVLNNPEYKDNKLAQLLIAKGDIKAAADILAPKPDNTEDRYSLANYGKVFKNLSQEEQKNVLKLVQEDKKATAQQINLGSPVAGVDPETGQPVFFQASKTGGKPEIVPGIVPKAGEAQTKQIGGIDSLQESIQSYKDALKTWSPTDAADPIKRAKMQTEYNTMMLQAKEAFNLGVLNGNDYKILTDVIADPTSAKGLVYGSFGALESQANTLSELMSRTKSTLQGGKGIKPKETTPAASPKIIKFNSKGERVN